MAVKLEGKVTKKQTREISRRAELAQGFYGLVPVQVIRKESDEEPLSLLIRLHPLKDIEDGSSIDKSYAVFANVNPPFPNPLNPELSPEKWQVEKTAKFLTAIFSELPGGVQWVNKMPVVDGEAIAKSEVDSHNDIAVEEALNYTLDLWNMEDKDLEDLFKANMVYYKRNYYTKDGVEKPAGNFFRHLPSDVKLLAPAQWEYYPDVGEEE